MTSIGHKQEKYFGFLVQDLFIFLTLIREQYFDPHFWKNFVCLFSVGRLSKLLKLKKFHAYIEKQVGDKIILSNNCRRKLKKKYSSNFLYNGFKQFRKLDITRKVIHPQKPKYLQYE